MTRHFPRSRTSADSKDALADGRYEARNDRWLTPLPLIHALGEFDLDPCAAPGHPTARECWTPEDVGDGLALPWHGRVWLNPPYGSQMRAWVQALAAHGRGTALLFARVDTAVFHDWVWPRANAILFLRGRLVFLTPHSSKPSANAPAPSVLIAYGNADADALARSKIAGYFVRLNKHSPEADAD